MTATDDTKFERKRAIDYCITTAVHDTLYQVYHMIICMKNTDSFNVRVESFDPPSALCNLHSLHVKQIPDTEYIPYYLWEDSSTCTIYLQ